MERSAQCPVCTLYLREGITLEDHLDTHPKDQVIKALCALSIARPSSRASSRASSRTSSRPSSRTPANPPSLLSSPARDYNSSPRSDSRQSCNVGCRCPSCVKPAFQLPQPPPYFERYQRPSQFPQDPPSISGSPLRAEPPVRYVTPAVPVGFVVPSSTRHTISKTNIIFTPLPVTGQTTNLSKFSHPPPLFTGKPQIFVGTESLPSDVSDRSNGSFNDFVVFGSYSGNTTPIRRPPTVSISDFQTRPSGLNYTVGKIESSGPKILSDVRLQDLRVTGTGSDEIIDLTLGRSVFSNKKPTEETGQDSIESILPDLNDDVRDSHRRNDPFESISIPSKDTTDNEDGSTELPVSMLNVPSNTFSVIKNIGNPNAVRSKPSDIDTFGDTYILPEIIVQEKISLKEDDEKDIFDISESDIKTASSDNEDAPRDMIDPDNKLQSKSNEDIIVPDITIIEKSDLSSCSSNHSSVGTSSDSVMVIDTKKNILNMEISSLMSKRPMKRNVFIHKPKKLPIKNLKDRVRALERLEDVRTTSSKKCTDTGVDNNLLNTLNKNSTSITLNFHNFGDCDNLQKEQDEPMKMEKSPEESIKMLNDANAFIDNDNCGERERIVDPYASDLFESNEIMLEIDKDKPDIKDDMNAKNSFFFNIEDSKGTPEIIESKSDSAISVNVIAFVNKSGLNETSDIASFSELSKSMPSSSNVSEVDESNKEIFSSIENSYTSENSFSNSFTIEKSDSMLFENNEINSEVHKVEVNITDEPRQIENQSLWNNSSEKELVISTFLNYDQNLYEKINDCLDDGERENVMNNKNYTELLCPQNYFEDNKNSFFNSLTRDKCSMDDTSTLNIQTDERMPPRGELSEQESSGDMDAPWAGMYRDPVTFSDVVGSTSYDLLAREAWPSDGSDIEMPSSPQNSPINPNGNECTPIMVSLKSSEKKYKCATCGEIFNCPKERRVHRTKEHPVNSTDKKIVKKTYLSVNTIKTEKIVKIEPITLPATSTSETIDTKVTIEKTQKDINIEFVNCNTMISEESGPKLAFVKVELEKKKADLVCGTCKVEFPTLLEYNQHLKIHPLECLTCGKLFNRRPNLQLHLKRHYGIKDYKCSVCDKRFITKQKMMEHYNVHTGKTPIKCNLCDLFFRRHSNMVQHRNRHHFNIKKKVRDYVCACGEVFHSKKKLAWHKEIHDDKPKACLHCNEKFVHSSSLTRHIRRAHNNYFVPDEKRKHENVECSECNNVYLKSSIDMHMKTHTGTKPFPCVICNKSFTTKWNLKLHKWTHANRSSKPFKCHLCKGAFVRQSDYISHMNAHKSVRPYTCNYCGCQFIRKYNCQRHVREHEGEKKYVCEVPDCGKTFHRSYYLTEHLTVHSGVRPYSCNICGKTSSTKSNHNKHVKIHHAREPITTEG